jgi:hypothetical protein
MKEKDGLASAGVDLGRAARAGQLIADCRCRRPQERGTSWYLVPASPHGQSGTRYQLVPPPWLGRAHLQIAIISHALANAALPFAANVCHFRLPLMFTRKAALSRPPVAPVPAACSRPKRVPASVAASRVWLRFLTSPHSPRLRLL